MGHPLTGNPAEAWIAVLVILGTFVFWMGLDRIRRNAGSHPRFSGPDTPRISPSQARHRDAQTRARLTALAAADRAFLPSVLEPLVQGPGIEGFWFFQVERRRGHPAEVTFLVQLTGDTAADPPGPASRQELRVFRLAPEGWTPAADGSPVSLWGRHRSGIVDRGPGTGSEPERTMARWALTDPLWSPLPLKERVARNVAQVSRTRETRSLEGLDREDFDAGLLAALKAEVDRWTTEDLRWEIRGFTVLPVRLVLARPKNKTRAAEVLCRVAARARTTLRQGDEFLSTDPEPKVTEESWTLTRDNDRWRVTERRPYP